MSRDIFVQDVPRDARSVSDIPDDWEPSSLACTRDQIIDAVLAVAPAADFSDPSFGRVALEGADIEVAIEDDVG